MIKVATDLKISLCNYKYMQKTNKQQLWSQSGKTEEKSQNYVLYKKNYRTETFFQQLQKALNMSACCCRKVHDMNLWACCASVCSDVSDRKTHWWTQIQYVLISFSKYLPLNSFNSWCHPIWIEPLKLVTCRNVSISMSLLWMQRHVWDLLLYNTCITNLINIGMRDDFFTEGKQWLSELFLCCCLKESWKFTFQSQDFLWTN